MEVKSNDEIDLIELLAKIVRAFKRNLGLILLLLVLGLIVGYSSTLVAKNRYESKMLVSSDILTLPLTENLLATINGLIKEGNLQPVRQKLSLNESQLGALLKVKVETAVEGQALLPETGKSYLLITAQVLDRSGLDSLQSGLIQYFESNEYVRIRVKQKRDYYGSLIKDVEEEIKSLESLKIKIFAGDFLQNRNGNLMFDPTMINSKIIDLKKEKIKFEDSLELAQSMQVIEGFTSFNRPINTSPLLSTLLGGFIGLFLAVCFVALKSLSNAIEKTESTIS